MFNFKIINPGSVPKKKKDFVIMFFTNIRSANQAEKKKKHEKMLDYSKKDHLYLF